MSFSDEFLIEDRLYGKDYVRIVFRPLIVFEHKRIVNLLADPAFCRSMSGTFNFEDFVVTTGGYDIENGFQYAVFGWLNSQAGKRVLHRGSEYPVHLTEDEYISEMKFKLVTESGVFSVTISSHYIEIRPKPSPRLVKSFIRKMKESFSESHMVFLQSARVKLNSAILDFLGGRYRSVPHGIYYAVYDIVRTLSTLSGMDSNIKHDKRAQERLAAVLGQIASGKHRIFKESIIWKDERKLLRRIDPKRYSRLITDLYEMRRLADYEKSFEIMEFVPELSNLLLKAEELLGLARYMEEGSLVTAGKDTRVVLIFPQDRELISNAYTTFGRPDLWKGEVEVLQEGMVLAENFSPSRFLARFLRRENVYYSPFSPPLQWRQSFVRCKNRKGRWTFSWTSDKEYAMKQGFIPYSNETVKEIFELTKTHEITSLKSSKMIKARKTTFSAGGYFFELYILTDGRFYVISKLVDQKATEQVSVMLKIKTMLAKDAADLWRCSSIAFSTISIAIGE
jgi:hypothetical protein